MPESRAALVAALRGRGRHARGAARARALITTPRASMMHERARTDGRNGGQRPLAPSVGTTNASNASSGPSRRRHETSKGSVKCGDRVRGVRAAAEYTARLIRTTLQPPQHRERTARACHAWRAGLASTHGPTTWPVLLRTILRHSSPQHTILRHSSTHAGGKSVAKWFYVRATTWFECIPNMYGSLRLESKRTLPYSLRCLGAPGAPGPCVE